MTNKKILVASPLVKSDITYLCLQLPMYRCEATIPDTLFQ